jgi:WD40 repeat protein
MNESGSGVIHVFYQTRLIVRNLQQANHESRHASELRRKRATFTSPQGDSVLSGSDDGTARLWDAAMASRWENAERRASSGPRSSSRKASRFFFPSTAPR